MMNSNLQQSIFMVISKDASNYSFGTAFVIYQSNTATYLVTCQHVVDDVGGPNKVMVDSYEAIVIGQSLDSHNVIDLAILKIEVSLKIDALSLCNCGMKGASIYTSGYHRLQGSTRIIRNLEGVLDEKTNIVSDRGGSRVAAWDVIIQEGQLQRGYSGSPVVDLETGHVVGVFSYRDGTQKGGAIAINGLQAIWPDLHSESLPAFEEIIQIPLPEAKLHLYFSRQDKSYLLCPGMEVIAGRPAPENDHKPDLDLTQYFSSRKISRRHFKIFYQDDNFYIVDLGSLFGTNLEEIPLEPDRPRKLRADQVIKLARSNELRIEVKAARKTGYTSPSAIAPSLSFVLRNLQDRKDVIVIGQAGLGKEELLEELEQQIRVRLISKLFYNNDNVIFPYIIHCTTMLEPSLLGFFKRMIAATKRNFSEWPVEMRAAYDKIDQLGSSARAEDIQLIMIEVIRFINQALGKGITFLINDLDQSFPEPPLELLNILAAMKNVTFQINYIFAMGHHYEPNKNEYLRGIQKVEPWRTLINRAELYWMPLFGPADLRQLEELNQLSPEQAAFCLSLGSKQPLLTALIAEYIKDNNIRTISSDYHLFIPDLLEDTTISSHCRDMWFSLSTLEQKSLCSIIAQEAQLSKEIQDQLAKQRGLLVEHQGLLRFENPLFERYIQHNMYQNPK